MTTSAIEVPVERGIYKIKSRNLIVGVYNGDRGFIGIREKMGSWYLFTEYQGVPEMGWVGTVTSWEYLGNLPDTIPLSECNQTICSECKEPMRYVEWAEGEERFGNANRGRWCYDFGNEVANRFPLRAMESCRPVAPLNTRLFDFLSGVEAVLG